MIPTRPFFIAGLTWFVLLCGHFFYSAHQVLSGPHTDKAIVYTWKFQVFAFCTSVLWIWLFALAGIWSLLLFYFTRSSSTDSSRHDEESC
ncbi:hypothetical protein [Cerasicoccus fimbriatus]|uniref:hypothetical protein n=1 Tax=Cerasicoccus fimbriatus TaxID=3014554 RepID=UPI0022B38E7E|nr:hypothetical protein [Cerasicoccus sp. TK19100]